MVDADLADGAGESKRTLLGGERDDGFGGAGDEPSFDQVVSVPQIGAEIFFLHVAHMLAAAQPTLGSWRAMI